MISVTLTITIDYMDFLFLEGADGENQIQVRNQAFML